MTPTALKWSKEAKAEVRQILSRFPVKQAGALPLLWLAQREYGNITPEVMVLVAETCGVPPAKVYGLYTFYTLFRRSDDGTQVIHVCSTLPCALRGSEALFDHISEKLGIGAGETTPCGRITLRKAECLAGCDKAPIVQVDLDYHENMTTDSIDGLLEKILNGG